jgi:hypothetical protein
MSTCAKDNDIQTNHFPKKYIFDSYYLGALKGYSKTGEITDILRINGFITEKKELFWQSDYQSNDWHLEIEIISDTTAKISDSDTTLYYNLIRKNGIVYLQSTDTIWICDRSFLDSRFKYFPLYLQEYPTTLGIPGVYTPCIYIIESNGELHIPFVSYLQKCYNSTGDFSFELVKGNYNNVFNTAFFSHIQNGDTIVYQDNMMIYKEK